MPHALPIGAQTDRRWLYLYQHTDVASRGLFGGNSTGALRGCWGCQELSTYATGTHQPFDTFFTLFGLDSEVIVFYWLDAIPHLLSPRLSVRELIYAGIVSLSTHSTGQIGCVLIAACDQALRDHWHAINLLTAKRGSRKLIAGSSHTTCVSPPYRCWPLSLVVGARFNSCLMGSASRGMHLLQNVENLPPQSQLRANEVIHAVRRVASSTPSRRQGLAPTESSYLLSTGIYR